MNWAIVDAIISEKDLDNFKSYFWIVYCDECKPCRKYPEGRPEVENAAYNVLVALENYRKAVNGSWV